MVLFVSLSQFSCFVAVIVSELPELFIIIDLKLINSVKMVFTALFSFILLLDFQFSIN